MSLRFILATALIGLSRAPGENGGSPQKEPWIKYSTVNCKPIHKDVRHGVFPVPDATGIQDKIRDTRTLIYLAGFVLEVSALPRALCFRMVISSFPKQ